MKTSKLLNKNFFIIFILIFFISSSLHSNEPVDIWNLENIKDKKKENKKKNKNLNDNLVIKDFENSNIISIEEEEKINTKNNYLVGLYDPAENDLSIDMWKFSDGEKVVNQIKKIQKIKLSIDAKNIYNKLILTNAFPPKLNLDVDEFTKFKIDWLIKNDDLSLIKQFIIRNYQDDHNSKIIKYYLDKNLSYANLESACETFSLIKNLPKDDYILKYKIYCLINKNLKDIAQLQYDLLKESGFIDDFFDKAFNILMGYSDTSEFKISEKDLLEFHLSHLIQKDFLYEPNKDTPKIIWQYLSSHNLLTKVNDIDLDDIEKIKSFEVSTNNGNYKETDLLELYTRLQFNIYQIVSVLDSYKLLPSYESRALLYQAYLVSKDANTKIKLLQLLKSEFDNNNLSNAFNFELINLLQKIDKKEISSESLEFYNLQLSRIENNNKNIKINNKIIHQSKIINYFNGEISIEKAQKDLEKKLKKIKKNKKYYFSTKDNILIESLISDGVKISEKYDPILELYKSNIPTDIEVMINDGEIAMILLRLVEIIGEDDLKNLGTETLYFIISTLNKLNIKKIRNDIILRVIPVKV